MWRSKCNGTLAERVNELERELAPSRELLLKGGMPGPECFRGDALDVGKLYALKQTAMRIKELGTVWTKCSSRAPSRTHTPIPPGGAGAGRRTHTHRQTSAPLPYHTPRVTESQEEERVVGSISRVRPDILSLAQERASRQRCGAPRRCDTHRKVIPGYVNAARPAPASLQQLPIHRSGPTPWSIMHSSWTHYDCSASRDVRDDVS